MLSSFGVMLIISVFETIIKKTKLKSMKACLFITISNELNNYGIKFNCSDKFKAF
jgi:hypothetical protein